MLAKISKTLYDGRVRNKIVFIFFLLAISLLFLKKPLISIAQKPNCTATVAPNEGVAGETVFSVDGKITNLPSNADDIRVIIVDTNKNDVVSYLFPTVTFDPDNNGLFDATIFGPFNLPGEYIAKVYYTTSTRGSISYFVCNSNSFTISESLTPIPLQCDPPGRDPKDQSKCLDLRCRPNGRYQCLLNTVEIADTPTPTLTSSLPPCAQWTNLEGTPIPLQDVEKTENKNKKCITVDTAVGEISVDPFEFVKSLMSILLSLAGGIAVLLIIVSGYRLMTSQGNPEAVKAAQEQLTSAIVGLLFIIFSLVILQVIGVDILKIPGFGR